MSDDFFSVSCKRGRDEEGRTTLTVHIGFGAIWLAAILLAVLVMMP